MGHVLPEAPWSWFAMINPFPSLSPKSELKKKTNNMSEKKRLAPTICLTPISIDLSIVETCFVVVIFTL